MLLRSRCWEEMERAEMLAWVDSLLCMWTGKRRCLADRSWCGSRPSPFHPFSNLSNTLSFASARLVLRVVASSTAADWSLMFAWTLLSSTPRSLRQGVRDRVSRLLVRSWPLLIAFVMPRAITCSLCAIVSQCTMQSVISQAVCQLPFCSPVVHPCRAVADKVG